jgi:hypothetical protein
MDPPHSTPEVRRALGTWIAVSLFGAASGCGGARALTDDAAVPAGKSQPRDGGDAAVQDSMAVRADAAEASSSSIVADAAGASQSDAASADGGLGDADDGHAPIQIAPRRRALAVAVGSAQACALLDDHTVRCWGSGVTAADRGPPRGAVAIAAADQYTCAILDDGSVSCWAPPSTWERSNVSIELGPDRRAVSLAMSAGTPSACAVLDDGSVRCWGGGIGPGTAPKTLLPPDGGPPVVQLALDHGSDIVSLYGDGTVGEGAGVALAPGRLIDGRPTATIATQRGDTGWCAMAVGGGIYCEYIPDYFGPLGPPPTALLTHVTMTDGFFCGLRPTGTVSCWVLGSDVPKCDDGSMYWCKPGRNTDGSYDVALDQRAISVESGPAYGPIACAVLADGSVRCWNPTASASSACNITLNGESACDAILGDSVEIARTDAGLQYGPWRAIDLGAPP